MKPRNLINVTPMIPGVEKETAADLAEMYRQGIIQSAMFSFTLVPEGNPVSDKAARLAELYRKQVAALGDCPLPVGILLQATIGHGWTPAEQAPFQRFTFSDGQTPYMFCPLDLDFLSYVRRSVRTVAELKPAFFMLDDDTRMHSGRGGCFCPRHLAGFNALSGRRDTPAELKAALLADDALAEKWDRYQQQGLIALAKLIRSEFDAVDPSTPGMFCTCNGDVRHAPGMAKLLAAKGQSPVLRINNPQYLYMHEKPFEMIEWMQKTAIQLAHVPKDYTVLAEMDSCNHNRCCTSAMTLHALYSWSLLAGCAGGKLWITDTVEYTPSAGKAYRRKLAGYSGFYDVIRQMEPRWQGVVEPLLPYPKFNVAAFPWGMTNYPSWNLAGFGFLGLPCAFTQEPEPENVICLSEAIVGFASDGQIEKFLHGKALLDGGAALALTRRGFAPLLGVKAEAWELPQATLEKTADDLTMQRVLPGVKLTPLSGSCEIRSQLYHAPFRHAKEETLLAPGAVRFKNELGGTILTVSGKLPEEYGFATSPLLNFRRKEFLRRELGLKFYYAGDAPVTFHAFLDRGKQTFCVFNLGLDQLETLELGGFPAEVKLEKLFPDGSWRRVPFENGALQTAALPMELIFLRIAE